MPKLSPSLLSPRSLGVVGFFLLSSFFFSLSASAASPIDYNGITFSQTKTVVTADGIDNSEVTIRVRSTSYLGYKGATVKLISSRGEMDEIVAENDVTNDYGKANFIVRSLKNGVATFTAQVEGRDVAGSVTVTFQNGLDIGLAPGSLIKIPSDNDPNTYSDTAVYYFASNGKRYVFPNEKVYFTWYPTFNDVRTISIEDMTKIPIGGNVTYHPGSKPVKFQTDNKVYAVYKNGELRWLTTEDVARGIYGDSWASKVDDINESFYVNYRFGEPLTSSIDFMANTIMLKYDTIEKDKGIVVAN